MCYTMYTVRQLSGITLSARPFWLTVGRSLCQFLIEALWQYKRDHSRRSYRVFFMAGHQFCPVLTSPFPPGVLISPITPKAVCRIYINHVQHWAVELYETKLETIPINIRPVIIGITVWFSDRGLSQRNIARITGVSQGNISIFMLHVCDTSLFHGYVGHRLNTITRKNDRVFLHILKGSRLLSPSRIGMELISRIMHRIIFCWLQRRLVVAGCVSRHQTYARKWILIIATCVAYWYTVSRAGTISTGLTWHLSMNPGSASLWSSCFLDATTH